MTDELFCVQTDSLKIIQIFYAKKATFRFPKCLFPEVSTIAQNLNQEMKKLMNFNESDDKENNELGWSHLQLF